MHEKVINQGEGDKIGRNGKRVRKLTAREKMIIAEKNKPMVIKHSAEQRNMVKSNNA